MGKARAARREQRQAKRAVARDSRTTKYANQKGGIGKSVNRLSATFRTATDNEPPIAVIRNGKALWLGAESADTSATEPVDETVGEHDDQLSAHKKLRALHKKLRRIADLKERRRSGLELDGQQRALLLRESAVMEQLERIEQLAATRGDFDDGYATTPNAPTEESDDVLIPADVPVGSTPSGKRLQLRRETKKLKHQEKLRRKRSRDEL